MRSVLRIFGLLSLSTLIAGGVIMTQSNAEAASTVSAAADCAKKRARGRKCDDDNRNGNRNRNRNGNRNGNNNGNRNGNRNSNDNR
jgi:hypothetical protein